MLICSNGHTHAVNTLNALTLAHLRRATSPLDTTDRLAGLPLLLILLKGLLLVVGRLS